MLLNKTVLKLRTHSHFCLDYWINNTFYKQYRVFSHTSFVLSIKGNKRWYLKLVVSAEMNSKWTLKNCHMEIFWKTNLFEYYLISCIQWNRMKCSKIKMCIKLKILKFCGMKLRSISSKIESFRSIPLKVVR